MSSPVDTTFTSGTTITSDWLNGVNDHVNSTETYTHNASKISFTPAGVGAVATDVQSKLREIHSIEDFMTEADRTANYLAPGSVDVGYALQAALDSRCLVMASATIYATSQGLVYKNGSKLYGAGCWSASSTVDKTVGTSVIKYIGAGGANSCVVRMSKAAVGIDPGTLIPTSDAELLNAAFSGFVIDANELAEFGLYMARAWANNDISYITVTGSLKHGFWAARCWNGTLLNWAAFHNLGAGITLGINTFGWSAANTDESTCIGFNSGWSGCSPAGTYQNAFNETTDQDKEYGIGLGFCRGLSLINAQAYRCGGAGVYVSDTHRGTTFLSGYNESNGHSSGNTSGKSWDIWINSSSSMLDVNFKNFHLGLTPVIRLTGTPASGSEYAIAFERMNPSEIVADWSAYKLIDCASTVTITGNSPVASELVPQGFRFNSAHAPLNSYNEGTWSPTLSGSTVAGADWVYAVNAGNYTRIGNLVFVSGRVTLTTKSLTATGVLQIGNLPYTVKNTNGAYGAAVMSRVLNTASNYVEITGNFAINTTNMLLRGRTAASTSDNNVSLSNISDTFSFDFSGVYITS